MKKHLWTILLSAILIPYAGFEIMKLWEWFIVPITGLPLLSMPAALGLSLTVGALTVRIPTEPPSPEAYSYPFKLGANLFMVTLMLLTGWIIQLFM